MRNKLHIFLGSRYSFFYLSIIIFTILSILGNLFYMTEDISSFDADLKRLFYINKILLNFPILFVSLYLADWIRERY